MTAVRLGIIGCGHICSSQHMPNLNQMQAKGEIEVVGYCDQDETKAAQFLKNYGGKYSCCDATSMLADSSIEAVLIAVGHSRRARRVHGPLPGG